MKMRDGKYMFVGNINAMFGPGMRYADTLKDLKLKAFEKDEIKEGKAMLLVARDNRIIRISSNGNLR